MSILYKVNLLYFYSHYVIVIATADFEARMTKEY